MISDKQQAIRRNGFAPILLLVVLALVIAVGGIGIGLAWRTNYLDKYLPARVKGLLGKEVKPSDQVEEQPVGKIAFLQEGEVWLFDLGKASKTKLTDTGGKAMFFHFSPDEGFLGYVLRGEGDTGLKLILKNLRTGEEETIVKPLPKSETAKYGGNANLYSVFEFAFSHSGKKLAYTQRGAWVIDLETKKRIKVVDITLEPGTVGSEYPIGTFPAEVRWSPDDKQLLVRVGWFEGALDYLVNIDGSGLKEVAAMSYGGKAAVGFLDDKRILVIDVPVMGASTLYAYSSIDGSKKALVPKYLGGADPAILINSKKILLSNWSPNWSPEEALSEEIPKSSLDFCAVYMIDYEGGNAQKIYTSGGLIKDEAGYEWCEEATDEIIPSPNEKVVALFLLPSTGGSSGELRILNLESGKVQQVIENVKAVMDAAPVEWVGK